MESLFTIIEAWRIANNPTEKQIELSKLRAEICEVCPSKKILNKKISLFIVCGECGCPLKKKIFTNDYDACPLGKWKTVEDKFPHLKQHKDKKLI